jgi:hypothetical protein
MSTKNRNEAQFDEYRDWQWIKHLILREYTYLWARILGSAYRHILAVDTCSGAGTYANPDTGEVIAEGSGPILGRAAKTYTEERGPGKTMRVICGSGGIGRRELEEEAASRRALSSSKTQTEV